MRVYKDCGGLLERSNHPRHVKTAIKTGVSKVTFYVKTLLESQISASVILAHHAAVHWVDVLHVF